MIEAIDLCRELQEALDSNSARLQESGWFATVVDPSFFGRLRGVVAAAGSREDEKTGIRETKLVASRGRQ